MSKNIRLRDWNPSQNVHKNKKQKCHNNNRSLIEPSESVLWPETEDSFFTDSKLDKLIESHGDNKSSNQPGNSHQFYTDNTDDSLFTDLALDHESLSGGENVGATPMIQILPNTQGHIAGDDTLFSEINLDEIVSTESNKSCENFQAKSSEKEKTVINKTTNEINDLFEDDFPVEEVAQCTQKFLKDVAFKIPQLPAVKENENSLKLPLNGCVQGTQYETHEQIQNRSSATQTLNHTYVRDVANHSELKHLSNINWDTQIFEHEIIEDYPCKGDFYGLPERVKQMIFDHKGIKSLYGKFFYFIYLFIHNI